MRTRRISHWRSIACALLITMLCGPQPEALSSTVVRFNTNVGDIDVRLFDNLTPNSVANFLQYVNSDLFADTFFHRSIPGFILQGGGFQLNDSIFAAAGISTFAPVGPEFNLSNLRGSLSFATNALGATSQFFFNDADNLFLDNQDFTVFGRVINEGQQVVDNILDLPIVNAAAAQDVPGEDFDEVPVLDFDQVIDQNDITNTEAVILTSVDVLQFGVADYDFDGDTDLDDFNVFSSQFGSLRDAEADGNGDGAINAADFTLFRDTIGTTSSSVSSPIVTSGTIPEPSSALLMTMGLLLAGRPLRRKAC